MAKWGDLKKEVLSPERIKAAHEEAEHLVRDLRLRELRKALGKTQEQLATLMAKKQASLSKMENQKDWMISTLAEYLHALGANLKVFAEVDGTLYPLLVVDEPSPAVKGRRSRADRSSRSEQKEKAGVHGDGSRQADGTT